MAARLGLVSLLGVALLSGCGSGSRPLGPARAPEPTAPEATPLRAKVTSAPELTPPAPTDAAQPPAPGDSASGARTLAPLAAPSPLVELDVPGHLPALVALPLGARTPRPIVVATHGAEGRPEGQCQLWQALVGNRAFVLCLRGIPANRFEPPESIGYYYPGHPALGQEIEAALGALAARYPEHADLRAPLYAGFSQGASMGALLLPRHPAGFARAALIEGGYGMFQEWNVAAARRFHEHGGERVVLACGRMRCLEQAQLTARYLERGGLRVRVLYAPGAGHGYRGAMEQQLRANFGWLIEGDPRF
jgi:hypothetical protein